MNKNSKYYEAYHAWQQPDTAAKKAVFGIIADLTDRAGLKDVFRDIEAHTQDEIIEKWMNIVERAMLPVYSQQQNPS